MATGLYVSVPCVLVWNSNNSAGHYERATTNVLQLAIGNTRAFVAAFTYPTRQGPHYQRGHTVVLALIVGRGSCKSEAGMRWMWLISWRIAWL
jgi:hypothetical protein